MSVNDFAGFWTLDSSRSDDYQDVLSAQGVSWLVRKVIANMTLTYDITISTSPSGAPVLTAVNPKGAKQIFTFDGQEYPDDDGVYGKVVHKAVFEGGVVKLVTRGAKNEWKNEGVWRLEDGGNTMVRELSFDSPKLKKNFKMTFTKKQ